MEVPSPEGDDRALGTNLPPRRLILFMGYVTLRSYSYKTQLCWAKRDGAEHRAGVVHTILATNGVSQRIN